MTWLLALKSAKIGIIVSIAIRYFALKGSTGKKSIKSVTGYKYHPQEPLSNNGKSKIAKGKENRIKTDKIDCA